MKYRKITFKYRKCGRVGVPWTEVELKHKVINGLVIFDMHNINAEVNMNFYRKMEEYIKGVSDHLVECTLDVLQHDHLN